VHSFLNHKTFIMLRDCFVNPPHHYFRKLCLFCTHKGPLLAIILLLSGVVAYSQNRDDIKKSPATDSKQHKTFKRATDPCDEFSSDYYLTGIVTTNHLYYESPGYREDWYIFPNSDPDHPPYNPGSWCIGSEVFTDYADCAVFHTNVPNYPVLETDQYAWMIICVSYPGLNANTPPSPSLSKKHSVDPFTGKVSVMSRVNNPYFYRKNK